MSEGIIYVLTNEAMPGYVKIGKTPLNPIVSICCEYETVEAAYERIEGLMESVLV